uniref:Uncharacterized protein n=1 Tax=Populus alba TaxID=43335 RepID=A0A4U5QPS7_POPAL|nr:hypothetical protein D5086_0000063400 [Populus alba]
MCRERPFRLEAARAIHSDYHGVVLQAWNKYDNDAVRGLPELRREYNVVLQQEEMLWYQKSREKWVRYGDRNTKIFHTPTSTRRKKHCVHGLFLSPGEFCTDDVILQEEALCYFKSLFYSSEASESTNLGLYNLPTLSNEGVDCQDKAYVALLSMSSFKSSGIDGFQPFFLQNLLGCCGE